MTSVELMSLRKAFGTVEVLHGLDIQVAEGEFVALVGPSGCGKSTLLRIIAGLEPVTSGTVSIGGETVNDFSPRERNIAMVFQSYALYPHMSVAKNIGFNLKLSGLPKTEIEMRVRDAARLLELTDLLDRRPAQLSGGQRQRVAMGRAIVRNPAVFLFDEPLSNLDAKLRVQMRAEIKKLHQKVKTTSIYVTHDQVEAMTLADRIVVMNRGRVEQVGTPLELYRDPANVFVAGFIGSPAMNFVEAELLNEGGRLQARIKDGPLLDVALSGTHASGTHVTLGIRPEHLTAVQSRDNISGPITLVEPTGAQTHVAFSVGPTELLAVTDATLPRSDVFKARIAPENVYVFDKDSGERVT